jgi:hypothetical protein
MLKSLFKPARFLDADLEDWHLQTWAWLMRHLGGMDRIGRTPLANPGRDCFPPGPGEGHARAAHVFDCVRRLMGMEHMPCRLEARVRPPAAAKVGELWALETPGDFSGTFQVVGGEAIITYSEDLAEEPARLVATLAHELSHYLIREIEDAPPGGHQAQELVTELTVAYRGLAVFNANTAFAFEQFGGTYSQGWRSRRSGYFSPRSWAFALAVFLALKGAAPDAADKWLSRSVAEETRKAGRYLAKRPQLLDPLRAIA